MTTQNNKFGSASQNFNQHNNAYLSPASNNALMSYQVEHRGTERVLNIEPVPIETLCSRLIKDSPLENISIPLTSSIINANTFEQKNARNCNTQNFLDMANSLRLVLFHKTMSGDPDTLTSANPQEHLLRACNKIVSITKHLSNTEVHRRTYHLLLAALYLEYENTTKLLLLSGQDHDISQETNPTNEQKIQTSICKLEEKADSYLDATELHLLITAMQLCYSTLTPERTSKVETRQANPLHRIITEAQRKVISSAKIAYLIRLLPETIQTALAPNLKEVNVEPNIAKIPTHPINYFNRVVAAVESY